VLSAEEERFHFGMWAINKSPLIIGAALNPNISQTSFDIMSNEEVIAINQDSLARQARLVRRDTEGEWDIWLGELSGSRQVLGVANWKNDSQTVDVDLASLGVSANVRDVWAMKDLGTMCGSQSVDLAGHELRLWVLSEIIASAPLMSSAYYSSANASLCGSARFVSCTNDTCLPTGSKVANIELGASVTFSNINVQSPGKTLMSVDFVDYDYAFTTAWDWGDNTRNMTIVVNGRDTTRYAFPLSGGNWEESGQLYIEVDGFVNGTGNSVVFSGSGNSSAPDLVGFRIFE
jgi:hypothetical protein